MSTDASGFLDKAKGKIKEVAGNVIGDDLLVTEGQLEQDKVKAATAAVDQAERAELHEERADLEADRVRILEERERIVAAEADATRAAQLARDEERAEQQVEADFARRERLEQERAAAQERSVANQEVAVIRDRILGEATADAHDREADRAAHNADRIDDLRTGR